MKHCDDNHEEYGFLFIQDRCNGCKTCEIACKDYHDLPGGLALRTIYEFSGGGWHQNIQGAWEQDVFCYRLSVSCGHCGNPVCMRICPNDAFERDEFGFVSIREKQCVGCQSCAVACPYHAPRFDERKGVSVKCDGCAQRRRQGKEPICVEACPQRALQCLPLKELAKRGDMASSIIPLPDPMYTQPNLVVEPLPSMRRVRQGEASLTNIREA